MMLLAVLLAIMMVHVSAGGMLLLGLIYFFIIDNILKVRYFQSVHGQTLSSFV